MNSNKGQPWQSRSKCNSPQHNPNSQASLRYLLKTKADAIRKSFYKVNVIQHKNEIQDMMSKSAQKGIFLSEDVLLYDDNSSLYLDRQVCNNLSFIEMFTKISFETKQKIKKKKSVQQNSSNPLENIMIVQKVIQNQFRKGSSNSLKQINSQQCRNRNINVKGVQKNNHQRTLASRIRKGPNFSKHLAWSYPEKISHSERKVKTENNMQYLDDQQYQGESFVPLGKYNESPPSKIRQKNKTQDFARGQYHFKESHIISNNSSVLMSKYQQQVKPPEFITGKRINFQDPILLNTQRSIMSKTKKSKIYSLQQQNQKKLNKNALKLQENLAGVKTISKCQSKEIIIHRTTGRKAINYKKRTNNSKKINNSYNSIGNTHKNPIDGFSAQEQHKISIPVIKNGNTLGPWIQNVI